MVRCTAWNCLGDAPGSPEPFESTPPVAASSAPAHGSSAVPGLRVHASRSGCKKDCSQQKHSGVPKCSNSEKNLGATESFPEIYGAQEAGSPQMLQALVGSLGISHRPGSSLRLWTKGKNLGQRGNLSGMLSGRQPANKRKLAEPVDIRRAILQEHITSQELAFQKFENSFGTKCQIGAAIETLRKTLYNCQQLPEEAGTSSSLPNHWAPSCPQELLSRCPGKDRKLFGPAGLGHP